MIYLIVEAAARSLAVGLVAWLLLVVTRQRNLHLHKTVWTTVLFVSLAMPFLMRVSVVPTIQAPEYLVTLNVGQAVLGDVHSSWGSFSTLYVLISAILLGRFLLNLARMWHLSRNAQVLQQQWTVDLDVRVSESVSSPATFGSTILLPKEFDEWNAKKRDAVMSHERSHVQHRDGYLLWLARLYTCVCWFNPFAWWMQQRLALLAESISDEAAAEVIGDRPAYAEILLDFASRPVNDVAIGMAQPNVSTRIERIISGIALSTTPKRSRRMLMIAALLPAVVAMSAPLQPVSTNPASTNNEQNNTSPKAATQVVNNAETNKLEPRINPLSLGNLDSYYPLDAKKMGMSGAVVMAITLDSAGRATDTQIVSEEPLDMGFGAAASAFVHTVEFINPTNHQAIFKMKVLFKLKKDELLAPPEGNANAESAVR